MRTASICPTCATYTNALCVLYNGPLLTTIGVDPLDSVEEALIKIDAYAASQQKFKVYTAVITQTGTTAPIVDYVLENSLGGNPVWNYNAAGIYTLTLANAWVNNKTIVFINPGFPPQGFTMGWEAPSTSHLNIHTVDQNGAYVDGVLDKATIEVRVYN